AWCSGSSDSQPYGRRAAWHAAGAGCGRRAIRLAIRRSAAQDHKRGKLAVPYAWAMFRANREETFGVSWNAATPDRESRRRKRRGVGGENWRHNPPRSLASISLFLRYVKTFFAFSLPMNRSPFSVALASETPPLVPCSTN